MSDLTTPEWIGFIEFLEARQEVTYNRHFLQKPAPWTEDPILKNYHFTNLYRELDAVTIEELEAVAVMDSSSPNRKVNIFMYVLMMRIFNSPKLTKYFWRLKDTFQNTEEEWHEFQEEVRNLEHGDGRWDYFISNAILFVPLRGYNRVSFAWFLFKKWKELFDSLLSKVSTHSSQELIFKSSAKEFLSFVRELFPRVGWFMAYEVFTSMSYFQWFPYSENDLVVVGPGAKPTVQKLAISPVKDNDLEQWVLDHYQKVRETLLKRGKFKWIPEGHQDHLFENSKYEYPKFTARTLEHSLCEYRKYCRIRETGKAKRRFRKGG